MLGSAAKNAAMRDEMSALLHIVAGSEGSVKTRINKAARKLGWGDRRTRAIWNREARRVDAHELDTLRREAAALSEKFARMAASLAATDANYFRADIDSLLSVAGRLGHVDRAGGV